MLSSEYSNSDFDTQIVEYSRVVDRSARFDRNFPAEAPEARTAEPTPGFEVERRLLARLGIGKPIINTVIEKAEKNGTGLELELLADGQILSSVYHEALANLLQVPFLSEIDAGWVRDSDEIDTQLVDGPLIRVYPPGEPPLIVLSPKLAHMPALAERCSQSPALRQSIAIADPAVIREAIWKSGERRRVARTTNSLFENQPGYSARITVTGKQGFATGLGLSALAAALLLATMPTLMLTHLVLTLIYLCSLMLRAAALRIAPATPRFADLPSRLPTYTVLVALYHEEALMPQLVDALKRLNWPASRLDIKLVCEADDRATIEAARRHATGFPFKIVEVPPGLPRTKPKALTYALASVRGEYLVIYDAEDRPNPDQLREAYAKFLKSPPDLACLQAPLVISNGKRSWLTGLFALEYSALFRGLLPMLSHYHLPLPLGGTSNHFKVSVLKKAGGWDPYNVTEDADLGIRLARMGWRCGVLSLPTLEDAPEEFGVWQKQRSRWYKGWMQTLLVHFRQPAHVFREIGAIPASIFLLTVGGMLFSALAHPFLLLSVAVTLGLAAYSGFTEISTWQKLLFLLDSANLIGSYFIFAVLGRKRMLNVERRRLGRRWLAVPLYWLMISAAAWASAIELFTRPHFWHKTPHVPATSK